MAKNSWLLKKQKDEINKYANIAQTMMQQFMIDTLQIALHRSEGWGYERLTRLSAEWETVRREFYPALDPRDPEADVAQEHMDAVFREICDGKREIYPFSYRYDMLKKVKY